MLQEQLDAATYLSRSADPDAKPCVLGDTWCWNDSWTFTAPGIPGVSFWSQADDYSVEYKTPISHPHHDTKTLIDRTSRCEDRLPADRGPSRRRGAHVALITARITLHDIVAKEFKELLTNKENHIKILVSLKWWFSMRSEVRQTENHSFLYSPLR